MSRLRNTISIDAITPERLRRHYLVAFMPYLCSDKGPRYNDDYYWSKLSVGSDLFHTLTSVAVLPYRRVEFHDYDARDWVNYGYIRLHKTPALEVEKLQGLMPLRKNELLDRPSLMEDDADASNVLFDVSQEWIRLYPNGDLHIVPTTGTLTEFLLGNGIDILSMNTVLRPYFPQFWRVVYRVGHPVTDIPFLVADAVFKLTVIEILTDLAETMRKEVGATQITQTSDGNTSSTAYAQVEGAPGVIGEHVAALRHQLYGSRDRTTVLEPGSVLHTLRSAHRGFAMVVS